MQYIQYISDMLWSLTKFDTNNVKPNAYNHTLLLAHNKVPQRPVKYIEVDIGAVTNNIFSNKLHTSESLFMTEQPHL